MVRWKVRTYQAGVWDEKPPRVIDAETSEQAAELVCGVPMIAGPGPYGTYRAAVWRPEDITDVRYFYVRTAQKYRSSWVGPRKRPSGGHEMQQPDAI